MRTRQIAAAVAALALTALTACSSSATHSTPSPSSIAQLLPALCTQLGQTFVEETEAPHELYSSDEGTCGQLRMDAFNSTATRDQWLKVSQPFGGNYLIGDRWVITAENPSLLTAAQAKVGGHQ